MNAYKSRDIYLCFWIPVKDETNKTWESVKELPTCFKQEDQQVKWIFMNAGTYLMAYWGTLGQSIHYLLYRKTVPLLMIRISRMELQNSKQAKNWTWQDLRKMLLEYISVQTVIIATIQRMMKLKLAMRKKFFNQLKNLRNGKLKYLSTGARVM